MSSVLSAEGLADENRYYGDCAGVSANNRHAGFVPAFLDCSTGQIYRSCLADGRPAPCHCLDGLPPGLVNTRDQQGRVLAVSPSVVSGFCRDGVFYTREQAARALADE